MKNFLLLLVAGFFVLSSWVQAEDTPRVPGSATGTPVALTVNAPGVPHASLFVETHTEGLGRRDYDTLKMVTLYINGASTDWKPGEEIRAAKGATVRLVASPATGYTFVCWTGLPKGVAMKDVPPSLGTVQDGIATAADISFALDRDVSCVLGKFSNRPGSQSLDLVADFRTFLKECGLANTEAEIAAFDEGDIKHFKEDGGAVYQGDGFPDIALFALVNRILREPPVEYGRTGGVSSAYVWKDYSHNLKTVEQSLPMASPSVRRVVAVYGMVDYDSRMWMCEAIKKTFSIDLQDAAFKWEAARWLTGEANADNDTSSNKEEWEATAANCPADTPLDKMLQIFVEMALDPQRPKE